MPIATLAPWTLIKFFRHYIWLNDVIFGCNLLYVSGLG